MITIFACISTGDVPKEDLAAVLEAAEAQLGDDYAPAWEKKPAVVSEWPSNKPIPAATYESRVVPCYLRNSTPDDDPDAVAYHWVNPATKLVEVVVLLDRVAQDAQSSGGSFADSLSIAFTHELLETESDEFADVWVDVGDGTEQPFEACDRVQGYSYAKTIHDSAGNSRSIRVTDFLLPDAFNYDPPAGAKFDFLGKLPSAFAVGDGGYTGSRKAGSNEATVLGDKRAALAYSHKSMARRGIDLDTLRRGA